MQYYVYVKGVSAYLNYWLARTFATFMIRHLETMEKKNAG